MSTAAAKRIGTAGQKLVAAQLLPRGWNVTIPDLDVGDDLLVTRHSDHDLTPIQIKTSTATSRRYGYSTKIFVDRDHLLTNRDSSRHYIFLARLEHTWGPFLVLPQPDLADLVTDDDMGTDMDSGFQFYIRYHHSDDDGPVDEVLCSDSDLTPYLDDFSRWEPIQH